MISALVQGIIFGAPQLRTSKAGKPFVSATIRVKDADGSLFASVIAFSSTSKTELMRRAWPTATR